MQYAVSKHSQSSNMYFALAATLFSYKKIHRMPCRHLLSPSLFCYALPQGQDDIIVVQPIGSIRAKHNLFQVLAAE